MKIAGKFDEVMFREAEKAARTVRQGGIILYPTDTVWGLGCDATNSEAVERLYALKRRADAKSMLALLGESHELHRWLLHVPETALRLIEVAADPLTIVYDSPCGIAHNLLAPDGSLGIRVTSDPFCVEMCRMAGVPVVSTSANISGERTPTIFSEISSEVIEGVDYIPDWRRTDTSHQRPSGIIKVRDDETFTIIR